MKFRIVFTLLSAILIIILFLSSCESPATQSGKARSIGNTSEILVVVENEEQWENSIGQDIREYLGQSQYGLNQEEPIFKLAHIQKNSFNDLFKKHHNILIIDIDKDSIKPKIELSEDKWAKPQNIFTIIAPSAKDFRTIFENNIDFIKIKYYQSERERILTVFRTNSPNKVTLQVVEKFGLQMTIPDGFFVAKSEPDFMWIRKETEAFNQGIVIFEELYKDTAQFSTASIIARMNRFQKQYIPGGLEGTYMSTDAEYIPPKSEVVTDFFTKYAVETRGLWKVEGDFMSGPFICYTFLNERNNKIVTLMGYVYQPNKDKRDLLLQMEAILYSTRYKSQ
jgi:Domain of unknown function (DUF4837)